MFCQRYNHLTLPVFFYFASITITCNAFLVGNAWLVHDLLRVTRTGPIGARHLNQHRNQKNGFPF